MQQAPALGQVDAALPQAPPAREAPPAPPECSREECDKKVLDRGLCARHYREAWRAGEFTA
ncbi:hypothetical protein [Kineococcus sp. SYSU DK005]|uniref:hypothetical protein n=1 Tax=Kineococcus sp. SYSU DK005 TaxID=3383126 RepID=UPI003D7D01BB